MDRIFSTALVVSALFAPPSFAADTAYQISARFSMPDGSWDYATSDLDKGLVYWVRTDHTDVIDTKTQKISILKSARAGHMATVVQGTSLIVVPLRVPADTSRIVDTSSDTVVADLPSGNSPDGAAYDPFSHHVFVVNHRGSDLTEIDPLAKKVVSTIAVGGSKLEFPASDGLGHVFVNVQEKGAIAVIDVKTSKVTATYEMPGCMGNSGLAYATKSKLLISSCANGTARVLMAETGKEVASIPIGEGPDAVVYDPLHEVAFIPCGDSAKLAILSVADPAYVRKLQEIDTPPMTRSGAIDSLGRLYLMSAEPDTSQAPASGRPPPKDGTYEMVVISPQ